MSATTSPSDAGSVRDHEPDHEPDEGTFSLPPLPTLASALGDATASTVDGQRTRSLAQPDPGSVAPLRAPDADPAPGPIRRWLRGLRADH